MNTRLAALRPLAFALVAVFAFTAAQCEDVAEAPQPAPNTPAARTVNLGADLDTEPTAAADTAVFAGGCFWCMEPPYEKLDGVYSVVSGFAGGTTPDPTYQEVANGRTDHAEVVRVVYDPQVVSYETLVQIFWHNVDPLAEDRQFCDRGAQYRSILFYDSPEEQAIAERSLETVRGLFDEPVATTVEPLDTFYPAEDYHQDFYRTNPDRYYSYRQGCGRDARLEQLWGDKAGKAAPLG